MLQEGQKAPDFALENSRGERVSLGDFTGKRVVVYFYPKDDTPGCTKEACSFRDHYNDILEKGAVVLGISPDSVASHQRFQSKFELPFHLLSDPKHETAEAYGAWGEKRMYGKTHMGILRSTFVIDRDGTILKVFPKVKPDEHGSEILEVLSQA